MIIDKNALKLSAQRALLFNLPDEVYSISIQVVNDKLEVLAYIQSELSLEKKDALFSFCGEICGDFLELEDSSIEFVVTDIPISALPQLEFLILAKFS